MNLRVGVLALLVGDVNPLEVQALDALDQLLAPAAQSDELDASRVELRELGVGREAGVEDEDG